MRFLQVPVDGARAAGSPGGPVRGRGVGSGGRWTAHTSAEGVTLRCDSSTCDEFWADVTLSRDDLLTLLAAVDAERAANGGG